MQLLPKWWNWHTQGTQNPPGPRARAGSTPAFGTIFLLLVFFLPSPIHPAELQDRIVADVNGEIVAASEIREWRAIEPQITEAEALQKIIREKLRLQDISHYALYSVDDTEVRAALQQAGLSGSLEHSRAFRRKLIIRQFIKERFEALVSVPDERVRAYLRETFPDLAEPDATGAEWLEARKLLEAKDLDRMISEWDHALLEKARIRYLDKDAPNPPSAPKK